MFEIAGTGWMNTARSFWGEHNIFPPWFLEIQFPSDHPKEGKGRSSCVRGHGMERGGQGSHKSGNAQNTGSLLVPEIHSGPDQRNLINERFLKC